jgi:hypothetical protein
MNAGVLMIANDGSITMLLAFYGRTVCEMMLGF